MAICKDCIHYSACLRWTDFVMMGEPVCRHFTTREPTADVATRAEVAKSYCQGIDDLVERLMAYYTILGSNTSGVLVPYHIENVANDLKREICSTI